MGIRDRKNQLIGLMKARAVSAGLTPEQTAQFELLYRRARTPAEQDQVTQAFYEMIEGWQKNTDAFALVRRDFLDDDDEDPPAVSY